ncbi:MAG: TolC family protein [Armatimonadota bacterium]|nr:TolC family protein [Armatimonadota bacterium]
MMVTKRIAGVLLTVCLIAAPRTICAQEQKPAGQENAAGGPVVTLREAINTALSNNKVIAGARERYLRSRAQVRERRAAGLPQLGAQAQQLWTGPVPTFTVGPPGAEQTVSIGSPKTTTGAVTLSQILDLNRRVSLATGISELGSRIQNLNLARTEQQVIFDVQNAYYNVLRAQAKLDVAESSVNTALERLRVTRAHFEVGTLPKFDVTRAEVDVANDQQTLISATSAVDQRKAVLRNAMGTDPTAPIEVEQVTVPAQPLDVKIEQGVATAIERRPEVAAAEANVLLGRKSVSFARGERIPALSANAGYNYNGEATAFRPDKFTWIVTVNASLPIFEGGAIKARVDEAKSDVGAAQAALDQAKLDVGLDVKSAVLNVNESYQRVQTAAQNVAQAEEALRLAQVRYEAGISLQVEVSDAETALTQARTNMVSATYDYATALASYRRATATQPEFETAVVGEK